MCAHYPELLTYAPVHATNYVRLLGRSTLKHKLFPLVVGLLLIAVSSQVHAFEPSDYLQWDQEPSLSASISLHGFAINDEPAQFNKPRSSVKSLTQWGIDFQYRLIEIPDWKTKLECYAGTIFLTHWDVPDRVRFKFECGPTFFDRYRIEFGNQKDLNIGISSSGRGIGANWIGASVKLTETDGLLLDVYGRYYINSTLPARLADRLVKSPDQIVSEAGIRVTYDLFKYVSIFTAPYIFFDNSFEPARVGAYGGLRFHIGKLRYVPDGVHFELGGHYNANTDFKYDERQVWGGITWRFH